MIDIKLYSGLIRERLNEHIEAAKLTLSDSVVAQIEKAAAAIINTYRNGGKVLILGNGGSYADAEHIAGELEGRYYIDRKPLPALTPSNTPALTAVSNDYGYDHAFERFVQANAKEGDVVICITTSDVSEDAHGHSTNIYRAVAAAKEKGAVTIGLLSMKSRMVGEMVDIAIKIPHMDTPRIQEMQKACGHIICEIVEKEIFG